MMAFPGNYLIRSATLVFAFAMLLVLGCGRSDLHSPCDTDEECGEGWVCVERFCTPEDEVNPDVGLNDVDGCTSDFDCGDAQCRSVADGCAMQGCNLETGQCEVVSCTPDCGSGLEAHGCDCLPLVCEDNEDCQGRICDDGACRACLGHAECSSDGSLICTNGLCVDGPDCMVDDDCRPFEMCNSDEICVTRPECTFHDDCGESEQCIAGICTYTPECNDDSDCSDLAECVAGVCQTRLCRGNSDCPDDEVCDAGQCVPPPVSTHCLVITDSQTIAPNERIALEAFAFNSLGQGVAANFLWTSSDPNVAEIDASELVGASLPGTTTVSATMGGTSPITCEGTPTFENLGLVPAQQVRVRVVHMETGVSIEGAEVYVGSESGTTGPTGIVYLPQPVGPYEVSVFHDDFNYLTVQGVSARDIRTPISPRSGTGPAAGFTGEFDMTAINTSGDIEIGLAGGSLAGDLLDINLERLLGDPFVTDFSVPGIGGTEFPLPGGVTAHGQALGFQIDGKQTYYAQSAAGPRLTWGIAGKIPFMDMFGVFTNPPEDVGSAIGLLLPLFSRFDHAQQPMILTALPRVLDVQDINNNGDTSEWLPDYDNFPVENLMPSVRQQLTTEVFISSLPQLDGELAEVAVLLGGTQMDGPGLVPLGISAISDEDGTGQPGSQTLYMAPPYGSAVGGRYSVLAIAFATGGQAIAGDFSVSLWNGQTLGTSTSLGTFPDSSTGSIDDALRTISVDATAGPIFRVRMVAEDRSWDVWSMGPPGVAGEFSHEIEISAAPAGMADIFVDGSILVDAIRTNVSIDDLIRASGVGLRRAGLVTTSFNRTTFR